MLNQITIHGYIGSDPVLSDKQGQRGAYKQVKFSVGVSRDYGDETDWFTCRMNGKRAEVIEKFFHKGSEIIVVGRMESYKPKDSNLKGWVLVATDFDFCGSSKKADPKQTETAPSGFEDVAEDLPF